MRLVSSRAAAGSKLAGGSFGAAYLKRLDATSSAWNYDAGTQERQPNGDNVEPSLASYYTFISVVSLTLGATLGAVWVVVYKRRRRDKNRCHQSYTAPNDTTEDPEAGQGDQENSVTIPTNRGTVGSYSFREPLPSSFSSMANLTGGLEDKKNLNKKEYASAVEVGISKPDICTEASAPEVDSPPLENVETKVAQKETCNSLEKLAMLTVQSHQPSTQSLRLGNGESLNKKETQSPPPFGVISLQEDKIIDKEDAVIIEEPDPVDNKLDTKENRPIPTTKDNFVKLYLNDSEDGMLQKFIEAYTKKLDRKLRRRSKK